MVRAIHNLTSGLFEHLEIASPVYADKMVNSKKRLLRGAAFKTYKLFLTECKESSKEISGDKWALVEIKELTMELLWAWAKEDEIDENGIPAWDWKFAPTSRRSLSLSW